ncbi:MAG: aminopeptidase P family protein [Gemmatimonadales bacterium]|nr:aminopeptidase P family protein [Gemmatimonadales bacterium]
MSRLVRSMPLVLALLASAPSLAAQRARPFGTLREQAQRRQGWLAHRLEQQLPALMRRDSIDLWIVPMREYNEDPVFTALVGPTTFAARRRTIYLFHDRGPRGGVERLALGGGSQGGLYTALRAEGLGAAGARVQPAELWGDEQWALLRRLVDERSPRRIAIDVSRTTAFADGLSAAERDALLEALGPQWSRRVVPAERLAVDLIAVRQPDEAEAFRDMVAFNWTLIDTLFSPTVVVPGTTRPSDMVWWYRQRVADLGLDTWFQPSITVQRRGASADELGDDPVIQRGDVLHCDVGISAYGLHTDIQHMAYVLRPGEREVPAGLAAVLARSNRLQDIVLERLRPGRSGNEVLAAARSQMRLEGIGGTIYSHPIGLHGHGAGPLIGLWDRQEGVPGRGDHVVLPNTWFSIELQVAAPVAEWGGQVVRSAQEEDVVLGADGTPRWAYRRQTAFHVIR